MSPVNDGARPGREEQAIAWCVRLASQGQNAEERADFEAWLRADAANTKAYDKALGLWHGLHAIAGAPEIISHRADALDAVRRANRRRWARPSGRRWAWVAALAASLVLAVAASLYLMRVPAPAGLEYATGLAERRTAMLEDGSRLSLDAETRLATDFDPARRELVLLSGRARFDVAHDPSRPFTVTAGGRTVVATGTSFSVELLQGSLRVIVYEGHVAVLRGVADDARALLVARGRGEADVTSLAPGRELVVDLARPAAQVLRADVARSLAWEGGQLDFVNEPLSSAVERLNRYSRQPIAIGDPGLAAIPINGVFNAGDADAFLEAVTQAYPVRIESSGNRRILRSAR